MGGPEDEHIDDDTHTYEVSTSSYKWLQRYKVLKKLTVSEHQYHAALLEVLHTLHDMEGKPWKLCMHYIYCRESAVFSFEHINAGFRVCQCSHSVTNNA